MTDLDDQWNELPTSTPPVDAILRAGRDREAKRRAVRGPALAVAASAALIGAYIAGSIDGNAPGPADLSARPGPSPVAFQADLDPAQSCDDLLASYRDRALGLVTEWGWGTGYGYGKAGLPLSPVQLGPRRDALTNATPSRLSTREGQTAGPTGTNIQEPDVDEPDTVKSNGKLVIRLRGDDLLVYDASGDKVTKQSTIRLPRLEDGEILLSGTTVVAIGADQVSPRDDVTGERRGSRIMTISIKQPSKPTIESTVTYSSRVLSTRQHGATVRLVLAAGLPELDFVEPGGKVTPTQALTANRAAVEDSTIKDWLPTHDSGDGSEQLLDCTDVALPPAASGLDTVSIVGFKASAPAAPQTIGLAGGATIAYESADHLYLADSPEPAAIARLDDCFDCFPGRVVPMTGSAGGTTHLYDFELDGVFASHVASGEIEGRIQDRWSLDEADDVLRVAVGPSSETGPFNSVVTLRRDGQELVEAGRVDRLGRNEEIKGVRWFDDLAVVVTYRQVDPLYTIDLADPSRPKLIGKLKIPGYSDYLHPLENDEMLGIGFSGGRDRGSAQIAVFDTSDLTDVKRTDVEQYPGSEPIAAGEPRAFTYLPEQDTVLTVLQKSSTVSLATIEIRNGRLTSRLTKVEYGADAAQVRTIAMPDDRVVLITGEDVRFFDLP